MSVALVRFRCRHEENLSYFDRSSARLKGLASPGESLFKVRGFENPKAANVLFGFVVRPVGDEYLTVFLRTYRADWAEAAGKPPNISIYHFAVERVDILDSLLGFGGRVKVVRVIDGDNIWCLAALA